MSNIFNFLKSKMLLVLDPEPSLEDPRRHPQCGKAMEVSKLSLIQPAFPEDTVLFLRSTLYREIEMQT